MENIRADTFAVDYSPTFDRSVLLCAARRPEPHAPPPETDDENTKSDSAYESPTVLPGLWVDEMALPSTSARHYAGDTCKRRAGRGEANAC